MSRIRIAVQGIVEIDVESEDLDFADLRTEAYKIFKFAKKQIISPSEPYDNDVI